MRYLSICGRLPCKRVKGGVLCFSALGLEIFWLVVTLAGTLSAALKGREKCC